MKNIDLADGKKLGAKPSTRDNILEEILSGTKALGSTLGGLAGSVNASGTSQALFAKETANLAKDLMVASEAALLSDGRDPISLESARLLRAAEKIIKNPGDLTTIAEIIKKINNSTAKLLGVGKERCKTDQQNKNGIVKTMQALVASVNALSVAQKSANPSQTQTLSGLSAAAASLKENVLDLDKVLYGGKSQQEGGVEKPIAGQLTSASRNVAVAAHEMLRTVGAASSNPNKAASDEMILAQEGVNDAIKNLLKVTGGLNLRSEGI